MGLFVRTLLIWLLVLAVPAKGVAAATLAFCGPNHHSGEATAQAQRLSANAHAHTAIEARTVHEHLARATVSGDEASASATAAASAKAAHADTHKCSACAACCSVGAILNTVLTVPAPQSAITTFFALITSVEAFAADGPERPPRTVLA